MEKIADTKYNVNQLIKSRWSSRAFEGNNLQQEEINTLFEAASWSASSMNDQPWEYLYANNGEDGFNKIVDALMVGNQPWAKNSSVLIISLARKNFSNGKPNRHAMYDVGAANTNLILQATAMGLRTHTMGGFDMIKIKELFSITDEYEVAAVLAISHQGNIDNLVEPFKTRETNVRSRKSIADFVKKV